MEQDQDTNKIWLSASLIVVLIGGWYGGAWLLLVPELRSMDIFGAFCLLLALLSLGGLFVVAKDAGAGPFFASRAALTALETMALSLPFLFDSSLGLVVASLIVGDAVELVLWFANLDHDAQRGVGLYLLALADVSEHILAVFAASPPLSLEALIWYGSGVVISNLTMVITEEPYIGDCVEVAFDGFVLYVSGFDVGSVIVLVMAGDVLRAIQSVFPMSGCLESPSYLDNDGPDCLNPACSAISYRNWNCRTFAGVCQITIGLVGLAAAIAIILLLFGDLIF